MRQLRFLQAMNEAYHQVMADDDSVLIIGEDIRGALRGETKGLHSAYGDDRVIDTPISEAGFTGFATGAALAGLRPIVQFQVPSLIYVAFDQLVNQSAKMRLMLGGQADLPVTYTIMVSGTRGSNAGQHSDNPYPYLVHAGFKVVCPSTAFDAKGLMIEAVRENDPVVFIASAMSLPQKGEVPEEAYALPLGQGDVKRPGSDVTVVAIGHLVPEALKVADQVFEKRGISVEVWDPRTLLPFDREGLLKTVRKTGRVVIYDDTNRTCGYAAEVSAILGELAFSSLRAPIKRVTRADVPLPFNPALEAAVLPSPKQLEEAIVSVWSYANG